MDSGLAPPSPDLREPDLPENAWLAMFRGARGRCPRCGQAALFRQFLKPFDHCPHCKQDWTHQRADDFPPYISTLLTGHIMAPVIIALIESEALSLGAMIAIVVAMATALIALFLQPAKGAVIALQWWFGMHGFTRERRASSLDERR